MTILQRGSRDSNRHIHSYRAAAAGAGLTRQVCSDCQHVSIDSPDAGIPNAAQSKKTGLFATPLPRMGLRSEAPLPEEQRGRRFGTKARVA